MSDINERYAREYVNTRDLKNQAEARQKELRDALISIVDDQGEDDEVGNRWLPAGEYLVKKERRQSVKFDSAKAEKWLRERGLWDQAKVIQPEVVIPASETITEEALAGFLWENRDNDDIPSEMPDDVYDVKESYALRVSEEEHYDY